MMMKAVLTMFYVAVVFNNNGFKACTGVSKSDSPPPIVDRFTFGYFSPWTEFHDGFGSPSGKQGQTESRSEMAFGAPGTFGQ